MTDVVVVLGSKWKDLETVGTRWAAVVTAWRSDPRVDRLHVIDYPRFGRPSVRAQASWLGGVESWELHVAGRRAASPVDPALWWVTGRVVRSVVPTRGALCVAATPLAVPLLRHLTSGPTAFDAVDDWRHLAPAQAVRRRVEAGYQAARTVDAVTAVSSTLARRLQADYRLSPTVVTNGVHLSAHERPAPADLPKLPSGPFAVYVGTVSDRVDLDLLCAVADVIPVVLAGPVHPEVRNRVAASPLHSLGAIRKTAVPALLARASVGLLLHHVDDLTRSMDPMKLSEYEAAGLPVLATALPGLASRPGVRIATTPGDVRRDARELAYVGRLPVPADLADRDWELVAGRLLTAYLGSAAP